MVWRFCPSRATGQVDWQKYPPRLALPEVCRPGDGRTPTVEEANDYKRYIHRHKLQVEALTSWFNWWGSTILA